MSAKFKVGDILIQRLKKNGPFVNIFKIVDVFNHSYMVKIISSTDKYDSGQEFKIYKRTIEDETPNWFGARYLTDEEKVEFL